MKFERVAELLCELFKLSLSIVDKFVDDSRTRLPKPYLARLGGVVLKL